MITRFLPADGLTGLVASLAGDRRVLVPVTRPAVKESVVFLPYVDGMAVELKKATVAPKAAVLPQSETLISYTRVRDEATSEWKIRLDAAPQAVPTIVFGCRPCDARGFSILDRPYLQGAFADPYYKARRDALIVITHTCPEVRSTCFCNWVGCGPDSAEGSDILFTDVEGGYFFEAVTEKGAALLETLSLEDGTAYRDQAAKQRAEVASRLPAAPDLSAAPAKIAARFSDTEFWERETAQCLSCGACTYSCPTCYCFNITDEGDGTGKPGKRLRTWDSCMSPLFTREASGHNPRTAKAQRMRNRISHKFSTYPETWSNAFSCNGCGRCISNCPVHLDIRSLVLAALEERKGERE